MALRVHQSHHAAYSLNYNRIRDQGAEDLCDLILAKGKLESLKYV